MSRKISFCFLLITIFFFLIVLNLIFLNQKRINKSIVSIFHNECERLNLTNYNLTNLFLDHLFNKPLNNFLNNSEIVAYKSKLNTNLLVWVYSKSGCSLCNDQEYIEMRKHSLQIGCKNMVLINTNFDERELRETMIAYGLVNLKIITILNNENSIKLDNNENRTIYFVLDSCNNPNMIYQPDPNLPLLTEKYFEKVINKYFKSKLIP